jgi:hypothetical protein
METLPPELEFEILKNLDVPDLPKAAFIYPEHLFQTFVWKDKEIKGLLRLDYDFSDYFVFPIQNLDISYWSLGYEVKENIKELIHLKKFVFVYCWLFPWHIRAMVKLKPLYNIWL